LILEIEPLPAESQYEITKENAVKRWKTAFCLTAALLLAGCASNLPAVGNDQADLAGTLLLDWVQPHAIEIQLDGVTYSGAWTSSVCATDACRGKFRNVRKIYRRHVLHGEADLTAKNGARMHCEWVSYLPEVDGQCRTQDGRLFKLHAECPAAREAGAP
jgi:hypothetical protein